MFCVDFISGVVVAGKRVKITEKYMSISGRLSSPSMTNFTLIRKCMIANALVSPCWVIQALIHLVLEGLSGFHQVLSWKFSV